jgi:hypothetical protein
MIWRKNMSNIDTENKSAQSSNTGSSYVDRRERRRELKRELRELRGYHRHGLVGGLILLLVGCVFLAANLFDFHIAQWWPLIPIAVGVALLARAFYPD